MALPAIGHHQTNPGVWTYFRLDNRSAFAGKALELADSCSTQHLCIRTLIINIPATLYDGKTAIPQETLPLQSIAGPDPVDLGSLYPVDAWNTEQFATLQSEMMDLMWENSAESTLSSMQSFVERIGSIDFFQDDVSLGRLDLQGFLQPDVSNTSPEFAKLQRTITLKRRELRLW